MRLKNKILPILVFLFIILGAILTIDSKLKNKDKIGGLSQISTNTNKTLDRQNSLSKNIQNFSQVPNVPQGKFLYGGSTTWAPIRREINLEIKKSLPNFQIEYLAPKKESGSTLGSGTGIRMLLDDRLAFVQSSRQIKDKEYREAKQKGYTLKQVSVAIDGIAIVVNPNLNIDGLTLEQIKDIYTGKIDNWSQIGGLNIRITPYSRRVEDGGTVDFFVESVIKSDLSPKVQFSKDTTTGLRQVAKDLGGIYYASASEVVGQCTIKPLPIGRNSLNFIPPYSPPYIKPSDCPPYHNRINFKAFQNGNYPITRNLYVIIKENDRIEEQAGKAYVNLLLSDRGQELIEKAGFIPLLK